MYAWAISVFAGINHYGLRAFKTSRIPVQILVD